MVEDYIFESWIAEELRKWPVEWGTHFVWEHQPKKHTVEIQAWAVLNGVNMRIDYEVNLEAPLFGLAEGDDIYTREVATQLVQSTKEFIDFCMENPDD